MSYYTPLLLSKALQQAQQTFALALVRATTQATPQANVFLSPFSVGLALLLALEGSAGPTRAAIANTLHVQDIPPAQLLATVARQLALFGQPGADQPVLRVASGLWAAQEFTLDAAFVTRLREQLQAEVATLDFASPDAAAAINTWVSQQTEGRIKHLVAALKPAVALVLSTAVYFRGSWATEFDVAATQPGAFTLASGQQVMLPLMHLRSQQLGYQRGSGWQAVKLPYTGYPRSAAMHLFVPDQPTGLPALLDDLTAENWAQWQQAYGRHGELIEVDLTLPRFRLEWEQDLTAVLKQLGLGPALAPGADFTPMGFIPGAPGFINQIAHKTYLNVDEQGTEAAGATVVWMVGSAATPPKPRRVVVRADHPFFCAIVDDETDTLLFAGAVYEPAETTPPAAAAEPSRNWWPFNMP